MMELIWLMMERMAVIVTIAFILTRTTSFRKIVDDKLNLRSIIILSVIFGSFGILGTYTGIPVKPAESYFQWLPSVGQVNFDEALANTRSVGVVVGGLLGGPYVGLGAGLLAGIHRILMGGFTGVACGLSNVLEGVIAGFIFLKMKEGRVVSVKTAFLTGIFVTLLHMSMILFVATPFSQAWVVVQIMGVPMLFANVIGITIFVTIIRTVIKDEDRLEADQAHKVLSITQRMLFNLRHGLTENSAEEVLKIIFKASKVPGISITDNEKILAHIGTGSDHHFSGQQILTEATLKALKSGEMAVLRSQEEIGCNYPNCPLKGAIIFPLKKDNIVVGALKLYYTNPYLIRPVDIELAEGLGKLLSHQLEVAEAERQSKLVSMAEIKALQAQVNPHFLFNSINTIIALIRKNPDMARELLVQLGYFFRQNLTASLHELVSLEQEMNHTRAYLKIEQVRFSDRLTTEIEANDALFEVLLPPLILQPLVENALRHGLKDLTKGCIKIKAEKIEDRAKISVEDNGVGISDQFMLSEIKTDSLGKGGIGLHNVNQRLIGHFGTDSCLHIEKTQPMGTLVWFTIPLRREEEE